ncbi:hypothetical protein XENTR_v10006996 [Xenopus tropicalis]|nr:hypothetical protein XENTR_v10006996 [Xenopus tropicalis]
MASLIAICLFFIPQKTKQPRITEETGPVPRSECSFYYKHIAPPQERALVCVTLFDYGFPLGLQVRGTRTTN